MRPVGQDMMHDERLVLGRVADFEERGRVLEELPENSIAHYFE